MKCLPCQKHNSKDTLLVGPYFHLDSALLSRQQPWTTKHAPKRNLSDFCERRLIDLDVLRQFSPHALIKTDYINALVQGDRDWRFRFLILPPELRINIYEELLTIPDDSYSCFPQTLATSKLIHKEAKDVFTKLLESSWFDIALQSSGEIQVRGKTFVTPRTQYFDLRINEAAWPACLRKIQKLRLSIIEFDAAAHPDDLPAQYYEYVFNSFIYRLCNFLKNDHRLKHIILDAGTGMAEYSRAKMKRIVNPLQLLGPVDGIVFKDANGPIKTLIKQAWKGVNNVVGIPYWKVLYAYHLIKEADCCVDLMRATDRSNSYWSARGTVRRKTNQSHDIE